jgi:hypothetical protein
LRAIKSLRITSREVSRFEFIFDFRWNFQCFKAVDRIDL